MELKQFSEELLATMKSQIEKLTLDQPDVLMRTSQIISRIGSIVVELKAYVLKYKFKSTNEEVEFFKSIKPIFMSQLLFHKRLFKINLFESFNDADARISFYRRQLKVLQSFMTKHEGFYHYALSNSVHLDAIYFSRDNITKPSIMHDDRFTTGFDVRLSKILSNELIKDYIFDAIQKMKSHHARTLESSNGLNWTGSKTDLIELVYALQASGVFNKSSADVKQIATYFENVFNVTLGNYYRTFQEIRIRKTGQINFISQLKDVLLRRIQEKEV
jgi:hypothetical protein